MTFLNARTSHSALRRRHVHSTSTTKGRVQPRPLPSTFSTTTSPSRDVAARLDGRGRFCTASRVACSSVATRLASDSSTFETTRCSARRCGPRSAPPGARACRRHAHVVVDVTIVLEVVLQVLQAPDEVVEPPLDGAGRAAVTGASAAAPPPPPGRPRPGPPARVRRTASASTSWLSASCPVRPSRRRARAAATRRRAGGSATAAHSTQVPSLATSTAASRRRRRRRATRGSGRRRRGSRGSARSRRSPRRPRRAAASAAPPPLATSARSRCAAAASSLRACRCGPTPAKRGRAVERARPGAVGAEPQREAVAEEMLPWPLMRNVSSGAWSARRSPRTRARPPWTGGRASGAQVAVPAADPCAPGRGHLPVAGRRDGVEGAAKDSSSPARAADATTPK